MPEHHQITLEDGRLVAISEDEASRLLYALTSIAVTRLAPWINVKLIMGPDGAVLWHKAEFPKQEDQ